MDRLPGVANVRVGSMRSFPELVSASTQTGVHFDLTSTTDPISSDSSGADYVRLEPPSYCSCRDCLLSLVAMNFETQGENDRELFVFEDEFDRLTDLQCQEDDDFDDNEDCDYDDDDDESGVASHESSSLHESVPDSSNELLYILPRYQTEKQSLVQENRLNTISSTRTETSLDHNDSGIGRTTDESVRADDSNCSEQEMIEACRRPAWFSRHSDGSLSSTESKYLIKHPNIAHGPDFLKDDELCDLSQQMQQMQLRRSICLSDGRFESLCRQQLEPKLNKSSSCTKQRKVPRMGTRREFCRTVQMLPSIPQQNSHLPLVCESSHQEHNPVWIRQTEIISDKSNSSKCASTNVLNAEKYFLTSDHNTGESGCSKHFLSSETSASPANVVTSTLSSRQAAMACDDSKFFSAAVRDHSKGTSVETQTQDLPDTEQSGHLNSLQQLYTQYVDVMYTNRANLEHTIMVQQKLFGQQMKLNLHDDRLGSNSLTNSQNECVLPEVVRSNDDQTHRIKCPETNDIQMEWVVKRRSDGSRYITRRPVRRQILKDRAQRLAEERCGVTTDDDATSELKLGRYWSRDKRKLHLEQARHHRQQKELVQKCKMETVRETADQPNIIELSRRKSIRHKRKCMLDNFVTIQEMLTHGNQNPLRQSSNPLLSVTTV